MSTIQPRETASRPHLYEIDLIRTITVFSVVALHTLSYTKYLITEPGALRMFYVLGHSLNYNREMFMFVTAFVLTYVYLPKNFSLGKFYLKRLLVVFVPYVLWSIIYLALRGNSDFSPNFFMLIYDAILTGTASFQLYYILLTLQFYALFPFFLQFIKGIKDKPWLVLSIGLILQLAWMYYDFNYIQTGTFKAPEFLEKVVKYRDRVFLVYGFFFLLGGISAVYLDAIRNAFVRFGKFIPLCVAFSIVTYSLHYLYQLNVQNIPVMKAAGALQPSVVLYSIAVITFFTWLATLWVKKRPFHRVIHTISNASFGIFFIHVLLLSLTREHVLPLISFFPVPLQIITTLTIVFSASVLLTTGLLQTPFLSWTVGKPRK